jgi:hypothetical protein
VYKHDPSISIEIGHGDSNWNVSLLLRAEKNAAFLPRQQGFKLDRRRVKMGGMLVKLFRVEIYMENLHNKKKSNLETHITQSQICLITLK